LEGVSVVALRSLLLLRDVIDVSRKGENET